HLALRVFVGRSAAAASTSDLSRESLDRLVDEAVTLARITASDPLSGLPEAAALSREIPDLHLDDPTGHDLTPEANTGLGGRWGHAARRPAVSRGRPPPRPSASPRRPWRPRTARCSGTAGTTSPAGARDWTRRRKWGKRRRGAACAGSAGGGVS